MNKPPTLETAHDTTWPYNDVNTENKTKNKTKILKFSKLTAKVLHLIWSGR